MKSLATMALALLLASGCRPPPIVGPGVAEGPAAAQRVSGALVEAGLSCEVTKESFVHCNIDGTDIVVVISLASTGRQFTMMVPVPQPACAVPAYHARIAKFNTDFILVTAGCIDDKTLILSHRSHLFRPGFDKQDVVDIVKKWFPTAVGLAHEEGLLGPVEGAPAVEPKAKDVPAGKI